MPDKTLKCGDCGMDYLYTEKEQEQHAARGFQNEPKRCPPCRQARRAARPKVPDPNRTMHTTACSACGKDAVVPFVPKPDKPVYCSDCFAANRGK